MKPRLYLTQLISFLSIFFLVFFVACSKEKSSGTNAQEEQASMVSSQSDAEAETVFNGIFDDVMGVNDDVGMAGTGIFGKVAGGSGRENACFTVTVSYPNGTPFPVKVIIDFGTSGCQGKDGHVRRGKIINEYSNRLIIPGAVASTTFDGFYFDSTKVEGTHVISNTSSLNTQPISRSFKVEVINGRLSRPNGNYLEWNSTKTITQIEGLATPSLPGDDVFKIEGSANGKVLRNNILVAWESNIIDPLIKRFLCHWIVKGTVKTVRVNSSTNNQWVAVLNFGAGTCDNKAIITINGTAHEITLP